MGAEIAGEAAAGAAAGAGALAMPKSPVAGAAPNREGAGVGVGAGLAGAGAVVGALELGGASTGLNRECLPKGYGLVDGAGGS